MKHSSRKSRIGALAVAVTVGLCSITPFMPARADERMGKAGPAVADGDLKRAAIECQDKMKRMADDPKESDQVKVTMAKAMLIDKMAMALANDPEFQKRCKADMADPSLKAAHDAAKQMCEDPAQERKLEEQVEQDQEAMAIVTHRAAMMASKGGPDGGMRGGMAGDGK